jgi:hypothetical protein
MIGDPDRNRQCYSVNKQQAGAGNNPWIFIIILLLLFIIIIDRPASSRAMASCRTIIRTSDATSERPLLVLVVYVRVVGSAQAL